MEYTRFATISSGVYRFFGILVLLDAKRRCSRRTTSQVADQHRMSCNHLAHCDGDASKPVFAAVGYNFRLLLN